MASPPRAFYYHLTGTLKLAIVAPEDEVYGLARLFSVHRAQEHLQLQVFRDRDAAFQWLDSIAGSA
jgi:hypothetical protein